MSGDGAGGQALDHASMLTGGGGLSTTAQLLLSECTGDGLITLLSCPVEEVMHSAIVCLGLKGSLADCRALAGMLRHTDPAVVHLAENSLWQIWMRAGLPRGNALLAQAIDLIRGDRFAEAVHLLNDLSAAEPAYAEAHNQRGIALYFLDRLEEAGQAFQEALRLNRQHFAAALSLGHTHAERGDLRGALEHYRHALRLHPRLEEIPEIVERLEAVTGDGTTSH